MIPMFLCPQSIRKSGTNSDDDSSASDEEYVPYIPVKQRKKMEVMRSLSL